MGFTASHTLGEVHALWLAAMVRGSWKRCEAAALEGKFFFYLSTVFSRREFYSWRHGCLSMNNVLQQTLLRRYSGMPGFVRDIPINQCVRKRTADGQDASAVFESNLVVRLGDLESLQMQQA